jgi:hypothetical protein
MVTMLKYFTDNYGNIHMRRKAKAKAVPLHAMKALGRRGV